MKNKRGFTLAEVIITLIVIGVVSAITIPMLNNDVNDKKWNVARQKAQATIGEAFKLATVNGYVTPDYDNTKDFVTKVLTKYLKINKQCDSATACGFSDQVKRADGKSSRAIPTSWTDANSGYVMSGVNGTVSAAKFNTVNSSIRAKFNNVSFFQTLDGFSVALFYNPYCATAENDRYFGTSTYNNILSYKHYSLDIACMNAVYDMNGKQGPNRAGYDIGFIGSFYNGYSVKTTAVLPYKEEPRAYNSLPNSSGTDYYLRAHQYCAALKNNWRLPDIEEVSLLYLNRNILRSSTVNAYWAGVPAAGSTTDAWCVDHRNDSYDGFQMITNRTNNTLLVRCIRANALK